jgi:hypothetical protein
MTQMMTAPAGTQLPRHQALHGQPGRVVTEAIWSGRSDGGDTQEVTSLLDAWTGRSAQARVERRARLNLRRLVRKATATELLALIDAVASRSGSGDALAGPDPVAVYPLVDYLSFYGNTAALGQLRASIDARGSAWVMVSRLLTYTWASDMLCD